MQSDSEKPDVARVVYREILPGDRRKFLAESNDAASGGGARDIRFRNYKKLKSTFEQLFPGVDENKGRPIRTGTFHWHDNGKNARSMPSAFHSPTHARPGEGRIASVDKYPCFDQSRIPKDGEGGRVLLLLVQNAAKEVWVHFVTEANLADPRWNPEFAAEVLKCLKAHRRSTIATTGVIDYETGYRYCNGS